MASNALLKRMASGIPGDISRRGVTLVEPTVTAPTTAPFSAYGLPGKLVAGVFLPFVAADAGTLIAGFLVRPYPTQTANANGTGVNTGVIQDRMRRGWMTVKVQLGTAAIGNPVYVRNASAVTGQIIGGLEAGTTANNSVIPGAYFSSAADADGNAEIEFNI